jgi:hypothetical protein
LLIAQKTDERAGNHTLGKNILAHELYFTMLKSAYFGTSVYAKPGSRGCLGDCTWNGGMLRLTPINFWIGRNILIIQSLFASCHVKLFSKDLERKIQKCSRR